MTSREIRNSFLIFFEERGHRIVPSSPVIPYDDPTLLFTNAGMNQFKDVFLGVGKRDYLRSADSQKCIRVSGKHNDLEEVGRDTYHHTFFEMLGNWSFGDYYKKEAIEWAWELLTNVWGLEKKRLYATIYETDDEAGDLWRTVTDIDPSHILKFGKKDNFWEMGETGPCGPCSEIHIDLTPDYSGGALVNAGDPRTMEIWNLVFIQYNRDEKGELSPLPAKHVDTGMGFERISAVLQKKNSNYDTDVFLPIIGRIASLSGKAYTGQLDSVTDIAMRVIADHVRMLSFSIADGGMPANDGRGYVMRRILRRAARFGRTLDMHEPFIYKVVEAVVRSMGDQYPELKEKQSHIEWVIRGEEEGFNATLDRGLEIFDGVIQKLGDSKMFPGEDAFRLYDTFGFPLDMTEMMARERGLYVDIAQFTELMDEQRERSRVGDAWAVQDGTIQEALSEIGKNLTSEFIGYAEDNLEVDTFLLAILDKPSEAEFGESGPFYFIDKCPFYAQSGGQVSDTGELVLHDGTRLKVLDTKKTNRAYALLIDPRIEGGRFVFPIMPGQPIQVRVIVNKPRRMNIERNHSATHLMHEALRRVLGTHTHQQGSLVSSNHLRFDFNHFERITPDNLRKIEDIVNEKIATSINVNALNDPNDWLAIDEAKRRYPNLKMFFGEKYGDRVRVVEIDPNFSVELCGGTHVKNTKEIGLFKIISESSIASGIRRIEAVTGDGLLEYIRKQMERIGDLDRHLEQLIGEQESLERQLSESMPTGKIARPSLGTVTIPATLTIEALEDIARHLHLREKSIEQVTKSSTDLKKELSKHRVNEASSNLDQILENGIPLNGFKVVSARMDVTSMEELKSLGDALRSKLTSGVGILGAVLDEKVALVCVVTDDLIQKKKLQAGKIVGELAKRVGGGGGGKPHLATAGGKDPAKLEATLRDAASVVEQMLPKG